MTEIEALRDEIAALRKEVADLRRLTVYDGARTFPPSPGIQAWPVGPGINWPGYPGYVATAGGTDFGKTSGPNAP